MILLIDNYDSFTFNLQRYLRLWGQTVQVVRNDHPSLLAQLASDYSAIIVSPGPCGPAQAGHCVRIVQDWSGRLPILGVCLGHQVVCSAFGAVIERAKRPLHGQSSEMHLRPSPLFEGIEDGTRFARYHSLIARAESLPAELDVIAWSPEQEVMAVQHGRHPTFGVQFHPESILSPCGQRLLGNFLRLAKLVENALEPASELRAATPGPEAERIEVEGTPPVVLPGGQRFSAK